MLSTDLVIRPEISSDHAAIHELVADAFGRSEEADLVDRIRSSPGYMPELALVGVQDGAVVGHIMVSRAVIRNDRTDQVIAMLSPLAVHPDHQRSGFGAALVHDVCARTSEQRYTCVVLEGSPTYYGRLGFEPASNYGMTLPIPEWAPQEAAQLRPLAGFDGKTRDLMLGGRVVYPNAFDGLD